MTDVAAPTAAKDVVLVSGIVGPLGQRLTRWLHREGAVVGIDVRPFPQRPKDVEHFTLDVRRRQTREVFRGRRVRALVHLSAERDLADSGEDHHARAVLGFQQLLDCVREFGVGKLVVLSSAGVYGPRPDNPQFLTENAPLLGSSDSGELRDLVTLDMLAQSFFWKHGDTETIVLRPCPVLGTLGNAASNYLRLKVVPTLLGFDPMVQVVHEEDVVRAILLSLVPGVRGTFNLAGPSPSPLSVVLQRLGRATVPVPHLLARVGLDRMRRWRMTAHAVPELDFIRYVCMVDDSRARRELGYEPRFDLARTLAAVDQERWP